MKNHKLLTALITGASSGIGYEFAKIFASSGYSLVLVARNEKKLLELKESLKMTSTGTITVLPTDLSKPNACQDLFDRIRDQNIQIDVLVNNAGFGTFGKFSETEWRREEEMVQVNVTSLMHLTRLFLPEMLQRRNGKILNVASTAAFQPGPLMAVYYATKAFVLNFSEALSNELKGTGVTVTTLCPGPTKSGFSTAAHMKTTKFFKNGNIPSSSEVAQYGFKMMNQEKVVAIHGIKNRALAFSVRLLPRTFTTSFVRKIQERRD